MMTRCSATACNCSIWPPAPRSLTPAARYACTRSTYYYWKRLVDRHGLEVLRPRERRRPAMPNQLPQMVEERILAFSIAHPGHADCAIAVHMSVTKVALISSRRNSVSLSPS